MRLLGGFLSAAAALLILAAAALYGANIFLQRDGGEITAAVRKHFPGAEVGFAAARVRLSWEGAALRAEHLSVQDGQGNSLDAPEADFWLLPGGAAVVLRRPTVVVRGGGDGKAALPGGNWALAAENAAVLYQNPASGAAVSLQNLNLQIKSEDGAWQAELAQPGTLRAFAAVRQQNGALAGEVHAEFFGRPPGLPEEWEMRATVRAKLSGAAVSLAAGGIVGGKAGDIQWHGAGEWADGALAATVAAASPKLSLFAGAPSAAFYARGPLEYAAGQWQWRGRATAAGEDGKLRADITLRGGGGKPPETDAAVKLAGVPVAALWRYVPSPEARKWMSESLAAGTVRLAHMHAQGVLPGVEIDGITAAFANARVRLGEGWPDAENLHGILAAHSGNIYAGGEGRIAGAAAGDISVRIALVDNPGVQIAADFYRAPAAEYLAAARGLPPARDKIDEFVREVSLSGGARAAVLVSLPFAAPADGEFRARVSLAGDGEIRTAGAPPLLRPSGVAEIDGNGARATVRGVFDGRPATLFVGGENITLRGRIGAQRAAFVANFAEAPVSGEADFELRRDAEGLAFLSDLRGVVVSLPPPLTKTADETATLSVHTDAAGAYGELHLRDNIFRAAFAEGGADIAINASLMPPPKDGIYLHGAVSGAGDVGAWLAQGGGNGGGKVAVSLLFVNSELFGVQHESVLVHAPPPKNGGRTIILKGEQADGTVILHGGMFRADLARFALGDAGGGGGADIYSLTISVAVGSLRVGDAELGALQLLGEPANGGWILRRAHLKNGANVLTVSGGYDGARTTIALSLNAPEVSGVLAALGQEGVISEGGAVAAGGLHWPDSPSDFSWAAAAGAVSLRAENLRYPHAADGGALSFLAVFSPQSLLRLGFTEIGKEGVRLNTMEGTVGFADGDAQFKDFQMRSEDVDISLEGAADMETRTLKLSGRVRPGNRLLGAGSTASIGAGLIAVQPLSLAAGWFLGKIFERPISEIGAYNYTITGPWEDPVYSETGVEYTAPPLAP